MHCGWKTQIKSKCTYPRIVSQGVVDNTAEALQVGLDHGASFLHDREASIAVVVAQSLVSVAWIDVFERRLREHGYPYGIELCLMILTVMWLMDGLLLSMELVLSLLLADIETLS